MGLYLGASESLKVFFENIAHKLDVYTEVPVLNGTMLLSSDGFVLRDKNGVYLTAKEDE